MNEPGSYIDLAKPELSDATAAQLLDFLYELLTAFENAYFDQLHRHYARGELSSADRDCLPPPSHTNPDEDPF